MIARVLGTRIRWAVVLAAAALSAACGTTAGTGTHGGGGGISDQALQSLATPTTATAGAVPTVGQGQSGAAPGQAPTGGSAGLAATGTLPPLPPGVVGPPEAGDGPGVSATTINVAGAYDPDAAAADAALGAANANPGDTKTQITAVINYINAHGGVAHRKLNPVWYKASVSNDASTTQQQACATWTQDSKTFVLPVLAAIEDQCIATEHAVGLTSGAITLQDTEIQRRYPAGINLTGMTIDRAMRATVAGLARQGYFAHGAKVGIVTWDESDYSYSIAHGAVPALAAIGLSNVPVEYVTVPSSYGDLSASSAAVNSAVLKFHQEGIDHVLLFDGPAGVNNSGILVLLFMQDAQTQHYNPRYGLNSTSGLSALAGDYPPQQMAGSLAVGWLPTLDETNADYPISKLPPKAKLCVQIMTAAGQAPSNSNQAGIELGICEDYFFLKQVLDPVSGPLNQQTALAAINAVGAKYTPMGTFGVFVDQSHHDGASLVSNAAFVPSCTCYRYTSAPYNPDS